MLRRSIDAGAFSSFLGQSGVLPTQEEWPGIDQGSIVEQFDRNLDFSKLKIYNGSAGEISGTIWTPRFFDLLD